MLDHFISLNCANCGAKLEVYDDMERFACGYCGTEMLVKRRGGTVALHAVTEAIKRVQVGTDRTAAELALVRLGTELEQLKADRFQVQKRRGADDGSGCVFVVLLLVSIGAFQASPAIGVVVVVLCIGVGVWWFRDGAANDRRLRQTLAEMKSRIEQKEQEIDRTRKTVQE